MSGIQPSLKWSGHKQKYQNSGFPSQDCCQICKEFAVRIQTRIFYGDCQIRVGGNQGVIVSPDIIQANNVDGASN